MKKSKVPTTVKVYSESLDITTTMSNEMYLALEKQSAYYKALLYLTFHDGFKVDDIVVKTIYDLIEKNYYKVKDLPKEYKRVSWKIVEDK